MTDPRLTPSPAMSEHVATVATEALEIADAKVALLDSVLRDVRQLARSELVKVAAGKQATRMAATLNAISTRIAAAQQALRVTDDAEHKRGHEKDDAEITAWYEGAGGQLDPAARLRYYAARKRQTLRQHGEELIRLAAADTPEDIHG